MNQKIKHESTGGLSEAAVHCLLRGFTTKNLSDPEVARLHNSGFESIALMWRTHEGYLRAEAPRRDIQPIGSSGLYFGEYVAANLR